MSEAKVEASLDLLAWRSALARAGATPSAADLAEWAQRLTGAGQGRAAVLLAEVAAFHSGFFPQAVTDRARSFGRAAPAAGDDMTARAMAELRDLGAAVATAGAPTATVLGRDAGHGAAGRDVAGVVRRLHHLLEQPLADGGGELAAMLHALASSPPIDHRVFASASLALLVPAIAGAGLIDFVQRTRDLWGGPMGSPILMHRAARLDPGGLGPYLANVVRLARGSRDVIAMARIAHGGAVGAASGADVDEVALAPWIALLARGCGAGLLHELVDDLGDAGAGDALLAILERATSLPASMIDVILLMRVRDAALDNADFPVATRAQRAIARLRPDSELEGLVLGSIEASAGERSAAASTFRYWLARTPGHEGLRERLEALEAGRFEPFAIVRGFGSPVDRQEVRLRRRGLLPNQTRRRGERIHAVEVH